MADERPQGFDPIDGNQGARAAAISALQELKDEHSPSYWSGGAITPPDPNNEGQIQQMMEDLVDEYGPTARPQIMIAATPATPQQQPAPAQAETPDVVMTVDLDDDNDDMDCT